MTPNWFVTGPMPGIHYDLPEGEPMTPESHKRSLGTFETRQEAQAAREQHLLDEEITRLLDNAQAAHQGGEWENAIALCRQAAARLSRLVVLSHVREER